MNKDSLFEWSEKVLLDLERAPRYKVGNYEYVVWPFKGLGPLAIEDLEGFAYLISSKIPLDSNEIVSFMTDGEVLAIPCSLKCQLPLRIFRDFHYNVHSTQLIKITQRTGYYSREMYVKKRTCGIGFTLIDAVVSTGGSVLAAAKGLEDEGSILNAVVVGLDKREYGGTSQIRHSLGINVESVFIMENHRGVPKFRRGTIWESI